jgi:outer membrane receptor protein involved in Fe transport
MRSGGLGLDGVVPGNLLVTYAGPLHANFARNFSCPAYDRARRTFEFEQLSISSISSVELSKTPTPDVAGSALAGVVNLRSKGAFDRKGRQIRWSASAGFNSHHLTLEETPGPTIIKI